MISSLSFGDSHGNSSVNSVTHCFHEHGIPCDVGPSRGSTS
jgi:hypothetical protein